MIGNFVDVRDLLRWIGLARFRPHVIDPAAPVLLRQINEMDKQREFVKRKLIQLLVDHLVDADETLLAVEEMQMSMSLMESPRKRKASLKEKVSRTLFRRGIKPGFLRKGYWSK